jgi:hypothetical protein
MRATSIGIVILGMCACPAFTETNYSKTTELPPLRISFAQLQDILSKGASLINAANGSAPLREDMDLRKAGFRVKIAGNQLDPDRAKIPNVIDQFEYSASTRGTPAPVSQLQLSFSDYRRTLFVEGQSPDQVDAVFSALRDDLLMLSSSFGGTFFKNLFGFPAVFLLTWILVFLIVTWFATRRRLWIMPISITVILFALDMFLPTDDLFAGFSALRGDASFAVRYGPQIALWSLIIATMAIPLSLIPLFWTETTASPATASPATASPAPKPTPMKRRPSGKSST